MYKKQTLPPQTMKGIVAYIGESIEKKIARVLSNKENIKDQAPLIYTDKKDGVQPDYDIRTDKYEYLVEGHDALAKSRRAKSEGIGKTQKNPETINKELNPGKTDGGAESTQTTNN